MSLLNQITGIKNAVAKAANNPDCPIPLVEGFEGCRLHAYLDSAGVATIGWGNTRYTNGKRVAMGDTITQATADLLLKSILIEVEAAVNRLVKVPMTDNQYAAVTSFTYNEGDGALASSHLLIKLNAKDYAGAADEFLKWDEITNPKTHQKEVLNDLFVRRTKERALFLKP